MRPDVVVQAFDIEDWDSPFDSWLAVRRKKDSILFRMAIGLHPHSESLFNGCHRPGHIEQHPILMRVRHAQTIVLRETTHRRVVFLRWTPIGGEFFRGYILPIMRTGRIINL